MSRSAYVDTSAFYAYLVAADGNHAAVSAWFVEAVRVGTSLFSSSFVFAETHGLLQIRHGRPAAAAFTEKVAPRVEWRWVDDALLRRALVAHAEKPGRGFTLVDACGVVCVRDRPGSVCVALDSDFEGRGFDVVPTTRK